MQYRITKFLLILASAAVLAACEGTVGTQEGATTGTEVGTTSGSSSSAVMPSSGFQGSPLDDPSSLLSKRTVYFEFDKSDIKPEARAILEAHAKYLSNNSSASVTLEGHADERGSREYNVALGERRAIAARQLMTLMGASGQQIRTVSYGEERPVCTEHNEACWQLNRRVEIVYRTR
ncbi:MAG: peptidoglycan-associated lipoprotein Pal [Gammaproteobacteria bacterium]|nr:peptidoglycan-associated lipoprotein Pal [Gammaproteobacteria bacterium]MDH3411422.1 peptidoglycan-associated lipoprotein Pal [Gammaproteobacteria bacterium]